jgi:hypothetical protein
MANLPLSFAELLVGAILLDAAIKGDSIGNVINGVATSHPLVGSGSSSSGTDTSGAAGSVGTVAPGTYTNPVPGAKTGRIDQGVDYTGSSFVAPGTSKILAADASNPGWKGGGWIAAQLTDGPLAGAVYYIAEGVKPLVKAGQTVAAGTPLASPVSNPYNGIVGNIEAGWANKTGTAPLAQSLSGYGGDQSSQALTAGYSFSQFVHSLGGVSGVFQGAGSSLAGAIEHAFLAGAEAGVVPFS